MSQNVFLSICMITYNHEKYIRKAIEGCISQKTDFIYELIIGEDYSSDKTRKICIEYQKKYPHQIKLLPSEKKLGIMLNFIRTLKACRGKYIAICEGDDYWSSSNKLQKQVDFLEKHNEYSLCFHNAEIIYEDGTPSKLFSDLNTREYNRLEIFEKWITPTASLLFRNNFSIPSYFSKIIFGDIALIMTLIEKGRIFGFSDVLCKYRRHSSQITNDYTREKHIALIKQYEIMNKYNGRIYKSIYKKRIIDHSRNIIYHSESTTKEKRKYFLKMISWSPNILFSRFAITMFYMYFIKYGILKYILARND